MREAHITEPRTMWCTAMTTATNAFSQMDRRPKLIIDKANMGRQNIPDITARNRTGMGRAVASIMVAIVESGRSRK